MKDEERARQVALRYCAVRQRSAFEIIRRLKEKGFESKIIDTLIKDLAESDYINDARFAQEFCDIYRNRRGYGLQRLKKELQKKGVASEIIDQILGFLSEDDDYLLAKNIAKKRVEFIRKVTTNNKKITVQDQKRIYDYLVRRGFSFQVARKVIKEL